MMIITTPMCLLAFSPVHGLHVPFSPNISAIKMKNYGKIITPQKHPPNQGNWNSPSLGIHITQTWPLHCVGQSLTLTESQWEAASRTTEGPSWSP